MKPNRGINKKMSKKILVTGGCGFIGSNFIHLLHDKHTNVEIFNLDCLDFPFTKYNHKNLDQSRYTLLHANLLDKDKLKEIFEKYRFDEVINFAACSHVDNSIKNPEAFTANNVLGTQRLMDMILKYEIPKFLHISTDEVYGSLTFEDDSSKEDANLLPNNPYSASKAGADCLVRSYGKTFGMPYKITRSGNNFGPYQYPEKFIPVIISKVMKGEKIPVYGKGENRRDWIYVEDNCEAIDIVRDKGENGEIYNIPGQTETSNLELAQYIIKALDKSDDLISFVEDRKGHDLRYSMDGEKIKALGFDHKYDFENGIKQTIEWYQTNQEWLEINEQALACT